MNLQHDLLAKFNVKYLVGGIRCNNKNNYHDIVFKKILQNNQ